jgi:hypothetical protein
MIRVLAQSTFSANSDRTMVGTEMFRRETSPTGQNRDEQPWGSADDGQRLGDQPWGSTGDVQNSAPEPWGGSTTPTGSDHDAIDELKVGAVDTFPLMLATVEPHADDLPATKVVHRSFSEQIRLAAYKNDVRNMAAMLGGNPTVQSGPENLRRPAT